MTDSRTQNRQGVGARIDVDAGGVIRSEWLVAGGEGTSSSKPIRAHFGLGDVDTVDSVVVHWPDGDSTVLHSVSINTRIHVQR